MQLLTHIPQLERIEDCWTQNKEKTVVQWPACDFQSPWIDEHHCWLLRGSMHRSITAGNLQVTLKKNACSNKQFGQPYKITRQPQVHISVTSFFIANTAYYIPARGKMSVHPRWLRKQKRIELSQESKLPSYTQHHQVKKKNTAKNTWHCHQQKYNEIGKREKHKNHKPVSSAARKVSR